MHETFLFQLNSVQNHNCATSKKLTSSFADSTIYHSSAYKQILENKQKAKKIITQKELKIVPQKFNYPNITIPFLVP
jgi:hypothetical protein